jgi:hypothetical protein
MNRLYVDVKEMSTGEIGGTIKFPADSRFTLEAIALLIETFQKSCEVPIEEIIDDLHILTKGKLND